MKDGVIEGKRARKYDEHIQKKHPKNDMFNALISSAIKEHPRVADFCCGSGKTIGLLRNRVKEIVGIDYSTR